MVNGSCKKGMEHFVCLFFLTSYYERDLRMNNIAVPIQASFVAMKQNAHTKNKPKNKEKQSGLIGCFKNYLNAM